MPSRMRARNCSLFISERATPITANGSGSTRLWNKDHSAGTSLRRVRSADAPKMTRVQESSVAAGLIGPSSGRSEPPRRSADGLEQPLERRHRLAGEVQADDAASALVESFEIRQRLCCGQPREVRHRAAGG